MVAPCISDRAPLVLTMGDPAGIGGEIALAAWRQLRASDIRFCLIDDPARLAALAPDVPLRVVETPDAAGFAEALPVLAQPLAVPARPGQPDAANAPSVIESIARAARLCLSGAASGMVTNPISKATLYGAGFAYPGHTEFLAALTGANRPIMLLANPYLRVVPVTIHQSLRAALDSLSTAGIVAAARIAWAALRADFGIARPRLAIAGLNPHAGEGGALGNEEATLIAPAIAQLREAGIDVSGPWPPDTMFTAAARAEYDVAICMYHDQALIPLKTLDMAQGVNITLGLPILRASPDHGTAFDIAGTGRAEPSSLVAALRLTARLAQQRHVLSDADGLVP